MSSAGNGGQMGNAMLPPLNISVVGKERNSEEKIHLFYRMIKVQISGGLLTD